MISQKTINEVFETAKVEDIVGEFVSLKKRGVNLIGLCPFHNEKTPSFTVSPAKNIYKCFGCGEAGSAVNFLMEHNQLSYPESIRYLANRYNIEIEETKTTDEGLKEQQLYQSLYLVNEFAQKFYANQLFETDRGRSIGLSYFKSRGFREETIKSFGLGYAPSSGNSLTKAAQAAGYQLELLQKAGLTTAKGRDFFWDRVQFVIHNISGKVVGFGGRILNKQIKGPKYINTAESEIYNKSKILYGAFQARRSIRKKDQCLMVEGYTDVISLHQAGIENVVSSSGTALTVDQIRLVKRYTQNICIIYDGDAAGIKAAMRGLDLVLEQDMNVKIVLLPDGEDPDSYMQSVGLSRFEAYIESEAADFILFKTKILLEEAKGDPVKKTSLIKDIVTSIAKIYDPIKRSVYIRECADRMEINEQILVDSVNKAVRTAINKRKEKDLSEQFKIESEANRPIDTGFPTEERQVTKQKASKATQDDALQEKDIVRLLVEFGDKVLEEEVTVAYYIMANMEDIIEEFDSSFYQEIIKDCFKGLQGNRKINKDYFLQHENEKYRSLAIDLMSSPYVYSENWAEKGNPLQSQVDPEKNHKQDTLNGIDRFKFRKVIKLCSKNQKKLEQWRGMKDKSSDIQLEEIKTLKVHMKLLELKKQLGERVGTTGAIK